MASEPEEATWAMETAEWASVTLSGFKRSVLNSKFMRDEAGFRICEQNTKAVSLNSSHMSGQAWKATLINGKPTYFNQRRGMFLYSQTQDRLALCEMADGLLEQAWRLKLV